MKYRSKLFYAFLFIAIISALPPLVIIYAKASRLIYEEIRGKTLVLAALSAELVDGDALEKLLQDKDSNSAMTKLFQDELSDISQKGKQTEIYAEKFYIVTENIDTDTYTYIMGINSEEGKSEQQLHDLFWIQEKGGWRRHVIPFTTRHLHKDAKGIWLSAFAAIRNSRGEEVALLGVDVNTVEIYRELKTLLFYGLVGLGIAICLAIGLAAVLSRRVTLSLSVLKNSVLKIGGGEYHHRSELKTSDEFGDLATEINKMAEGLLERERLKAGFSKYVSAHTLEEIMKRDTPVALHGERKKVTIVFTDIRNFTSIAERLSPEEVLTLLNEYFEKMIAITFQFQGTLDKFMGDGMMVEFGAPLDDDQQEHHAISAAIAMEKALRALNSKWAKEGRDTIQMGIGIHTGWAVVGNIGSERRMEYTAVGDAVNVASRMEQATKILDKTIIISEETHKSVADMYEYEDLGYINLAGREQDVRAYSIKVD